jgi:hypothetical protein
MKNNTLLGVVHKSGGKKRNHGTYGKKTERYGKEMTGMRLSI